MKKLLATICAGAVLGLMASCDDAPGKAKAYNQGINIIPTPVSLTQNEGNFKLNKNTKIYASTPEAKTVAEFFAAKMNTATGYQIATADKETSDGISLVIDGSLDVNDEGYTLDVADSGVRIKAKTPQGLFYGMQSFLQLLPAEIESPSAVKGIAWTAPAVSIKDEPRFGYRGIMLDPCRHFIPVENIKKQLDVLALFKINRMHWHLTDDQGWRIEIKKYPKLTEIGSKRIDGEGTEYGGFYTQEEVKDIVKYAADRFITIVPEIELPGHEMAAIAAYPELSCEGKQGTPRIIWGVEDIVLCAGKEEPFQFFEDVIAEVAPLFPGEYFHIGGDECPKTSWEKCPLCQARIRKEGLKGDKEHSAEEKLQSYFVQRMEKVVNKHGKKMIGWDEIIEGGLSKTSTVMWWRNWAPQSVPEATAHGNDVIYTPATPFYFSQNEEKSSMRQVYDYDLAPASLSAAQRAHIIGVQANLWAEGIPSRSRMLYMYFPRILALAELAWTQPAQKDYDDFYGRLRQQLSMLNRLGVPYRIPSLDGFHNVNAFTDKSTLSVECQDPQAVIRYTTDGTFPNAESPRYVGPITVDQTTPFTLRTFTPEGRADEMVQADFVKQGLLPALQSVPALNPGVKTDWYDFPGVTCRLITTAPFNGSYTTPDVVIPEACKGNIGLITKGYILIPEDGVYTFALLSDDGSWLKIDGNMVVDNDREQSPHEMVC